MEIVGLHCFLVHPSKRETEQPQIGGTAVPRKGKLFKMLSSIFDNAETDCSMDIVFSPNSTGEQQNDCRDLICAYAKSHLIEHGREIALRLQRVTTQKSGLGLLFLMVGMDKTNTKIVISRFPADQGILAEESKTTLSVQFLEKVFMKSATAYKAALYSGHSFEDEFWLGKAVDKQINHPGEQIAHYWVQHFLASEHQTTPAAGSMRLALALRTAIEHSQDFQAKSELLAAITLATGFEGRTTTPEGFCQSLGLSENAVAEVRSALKSEGLATQQFQFDAAEFKKHIAFRSVELDNGAVLTADAIKFDEVFRHEPIRPRGKQVRFTTEGEVIGERLRKTRP